VLLVILLVIVLPAVAAVGLVMAYIQVIWRRAPFPSPVAPDPACPFCGHMKRHGRVMYSRYPLWWEPRDAPPPRVWLLKPGSPPVRGAVAVFERSRAKVQVRGASVCDTCEAVVFDPKV
jgi:hypothetical protein